MKHDARVHAVSCLLVGIATLMCSSAALAEDRFAGKIIDLTHAFNSETIYWPTGQPFQLERGNNGRTAKGYYYAANRFTTAEHCGTHLDAPIHFSEGNQSAEQVPLERLIGAAAVIDVVDSCARDVDYQITVSDLNAWEVKHQRQLVDVIVLLKTGWSKFWPDRGRYLGTTRLGPEAIAELRFPGLAPEAARWLVEHRAVKAIGIDTASIDHGRSTHFDSHVLLCGHKVPIFENVANLDPLPAHGANVIALPMKITGGSGGPLRIVAFVAD